MRKYLTILALIASCSAAHADFTGKNAAAATITFKNPGDCTAVVCVPIFSLFDSTGANSAAVTTAGADGVSNTLSGLAVYDRMLIYNGTTWDRWQGAIKASSGAFASGSIASGAFASGSIASGAVASGAIASGAIAAGALAAGSGVDGWDLTQGAIADAAVTAGATGSVSAKLRAISRDIGTVVTNTAAAIPAGTAVIGKVGIDQTTPGTTNAISLNGGLATASQDPCTGGLKTNLAISQNGTSSVQLIALSGSTKIYVCSLSIVAAGATTVAFTTGTGSACVTGNAAVIGTTTASIANSISLAANGGMTLGSGSGTIASGAASSELCMILGTSVFVSGNLTYVQQ